MTICTDKESLTHRIIGIKARPSQQDELQVNLRIKNCKYTILNNLTSKNDDVRNQVTNHVQGMCQRVLVQLRNASVNTLCVCEKDLNKSGRRRMCVYHRIHFTIQ